MMVPNYLYQAYEEGKRSIDFLLLFPVSRSDSEHILATIKKMSRSTRCQMAIWNGYRNSLY